MPVIAVKKEVLYEKIGLDENFSVEQFQDLCFDFGIELDNVVTEKELKSGGDKTESDVIYYKIEVPANRYDLLCVEGLAYSLAVFMGKKEILTVNLESSKENDFYVKIEKSVEKIRPYIVSAVIKNVELNDESFKSLIELQEKLHFNICRDRTLASIGVHNFDALKMPITYKALRNDSKSFVALNETESFTVEQLFNVYRKRSVCSVRPYLSILEGFDESPFVLDANDNVCSLPPIINSELTKVSENTKNIFLDITATDFTKAKIVLNTICFSLKLMSPDCSIYPVAIQSESETRDILLPELSDRRMTIDVDYINRGTGVKLSPIDIAKKLRRMQITPVNEISNNDESITVSIPATRADILHNCDVLEDVAIAIGYNNIPKTLPKSLTTGKQQPINAFSNKLRSVAAQCGYTEVLTWILTSIEDNFVRLNKQCSSEDYVEVLKPKTKELEICRTLLLPGVLKSAAHNLGQTSLPIRIFEVGDVVLRKNSALRKEDRLYNGQDGSGAVNRRHLCALYMGKSTESFEILNGLLDRLMLSCGASFGSDLSDSGFGYRLEESALKSFFPGRQADIVLSEKGRDDVVIGNLGLIHPEVSESFSESIPSNGLLVSSLEIDIEVLLERGLMN